MSLLALRPLLAGLALRAAGAVADAVVAALSLADPRFPRLRSDEDLAMTAPSLWCCWMRGALDKLD